MIQRFFLQTEKTDQTADLSLYLYKPLFEPWHDKTNKMSVRSVKTHISLGIRPVWSESLLCSQWVAKDPSFLHADSEDSDQTGRMPRLIWVFAGRTSHFVGFVMSRLNCWKTKQILTYNCHLRQISVVPLYIAQISDSSVHGLAPLNCLKCNEIGYFKCMLWICLSSYFQPIRKEYVDWPTHQPITGLNKIFVYFVLSANMYKTSEIRHIWWKWGHLLGMDT